MEDWGDATFQSRFRMTEEAVNELCGMIKHHFPEQKKMVRKRIPVMDKLLITLRYNAGGCYQKTAGD